MRIPRPFGRLARAIAPSMRSSRSRFGVPTRTVSASSKARGELRVRVAPGFHAGDSGLHVGIAVERLVVIAKCEKEMPRPRDLRGKLLFGPIADPRADP